MLLTYVLVSNIYIYVIFQFTALIKLAMFIMLTEWSGVSRIFRKMSELFGNFILSGEWSPGSNEVLLIFISDDGGGQSVLQSTSRLTAASGKEAELLETAIASLK